MSQRHTTRSPAAAATRINHSKHVSTDDLNGPSTGKGHIATVEKNMPSIIGVLGSVDRLYRPAIAERIFGPPTEVSDERAVADGRRHAQEQSARASGDYVPIKPFNHHNSLPTPATNDPYPKQPNDNQGVVVDLNQASTRPLLHRQALNAHQLQQRAAMLEYQLHVCDGRIRNHEAEVAIVAGLRDIHIAKKKTRLAHIPQYEPMHVQTRKHPELIQEGHLAHRSAERAVNVNPLADYKRVTTFVHGGGIPGQVGGGYSLTERLRNSRRQNRSGGNQIGAEGGDATFISGAGTLTVTIGNDSTTNASSSRATPAEDDRASNYGPSDTTSRRLDNRNAQLLHQHQAISTTPTYSSQLTTPPSAASSGGSIMTRGSDGGPSMRSSDRWRNATKVGSLALMDRVAVPVLRCLTSEPKRGPKTFPHTFNCNAPFAVQRTLDAPRREMAHAHMTRPVKWLEREVKKTVDHFNHTIVFTTPADASQRAELQLRPSTIPLPPPSNAKGTVLT